MEENEKVMNRGGEPADGTLLLLGITQSLPVDGQLLSAASFQETAGRTCVRATRLTRMQLAGRRSRLELPL
jgi:hypothetical protein